MDLILDELYQELHCHSFMVSLDSVVEIVILLIIHQVKYVFQMIQNFKKDFKNDSK